MDTWTELIDGPIKSELLQSEMLFQKMIDFIPLIALFAVIMFFGLVGLLAVLVPFLKNKFHILLFRRM